MSRRNSLDQLRDLKAEIKLQGYCTNAVIRAKLMATGRTNSEDKNDPQQCEKCSMSPGEASCCPQKGLLSKLKDTVAHHKIELHIPSILSLMPQKGDLLEDFPSSKKEPFWKALSLSRHQHDECDITENTNQTAPTIAKVKEIHDAPNHNFACTAYRDSEEFTMGCATQQRRLSDSFSVLETCNPPLGRSPKVTSDDLLSHLLDSELPSMDLNFSHSSFARLSGDLIVGGKAIGRRRSEIRGSTIGQEQGKQSLRRSSNLLELDNAQQYGGLSPFGT